jgi:hypothetical protein
MVEPAQTWVEVWDEKDRAKPLPLFLHGLFMNSKNLVSRN